MIRHFLLLLALVGLDPSGFAGTPEGWNQLKLGMTSPEALEALGDPLVKNVGKGFELWIYDRHAEVLFYGGVGIAWTTPKAGKAPNHAVDVWQFRPGELYLPAFVVPVKQPKTTVPWRDANAYSYDQLPTYRQKIRR